MKAAGDNGYTTDTEVLSAQLSSPWIRVLTTSHHTPKLILSHIGKRVTVTCGSLLSELTLVATRTPRGYNEHRPVAGHNRDGDSSSDRRQPSSMCGEPWRYDNSSGILPDSGIRLLAGDYDCDKHNDPEAKGKLPTSPMNPGYYVFLTPNKGALLNNAFVVSESEYLTTVFIE
jgi:hypothetical protein